MKPSSSKIDTVLQLLHHYIYTPHHTTNWTSTDTSNGTLPNSPKNLRTLTPTFEVRTPEAGGKICAAQISNISVQAANKGAVAAKKFWDGKLHELRRRLRAWASLGTKPRKGTSAQSFVNIAILLPSHAVSLFVVGGVGTKGVVPNSGQLLAEGNKNHHPMGNFPPESKD